jgi:hypothetical protein
MSRLLSAGWRPETLDGIVPAIMASRSVAEASTPAVAERLRLLREALGIDQAEMCRQTGIGTSAWNNAETGDNRIGVDNAMKIRKRYSVGLDYVYANDYTAIPSKLATKIGRLRARQSGSKRA